MITNRAEFKEYLRIFNEHIKRLGIYHPHVMAMAYAFDAVAEDMARAEGLTVKEFYDTIEKEMEAEA